MDIEVENVDKRKRSIPEKLAQTYSPFTGMDGVQLAQTLDQTARGPNPNGSLLRTKENQVIYRWSEKQAEASRELKKRNVIVSSGSAANKLKRLLKRTVGLLIKSHKPSPEPGNLALDNPDDEGDVPKDISRKWLNVRQLWLWKLADSTTRLVF